MVGTVVEGESLRRASGRQVAALESVVAVRGDEVVMPR
jgi:hypothetical protein